MATNTDDWDEVPVDKIDTSGWEEVPAQNAADTFTPAAVDVYKEPELDNSGINSVTNTIGTYVMNPEGLSRDIITHIPSVVKGMSYGFSDEIGGAQAATEQAAGSFADWLLRRANQPELADKVDNLVYTETGVDPRQGVDGIKKVYTQNRDLLREQQNRSARESPVTAAAAELGGALLAPGPKGGKIGGPGVSAGSAALQGAKQGAKIGGMTGAAFGVGASESDDLLDVVLDGIKTGAFGGIGGGALSGIMSGAGQAARNFGARRGFGSVGVDPSKAAKLADESLEPALSDLSNQAAAPKERTLSNYLEQQGIPIKNDNIMQDFMRDSGVLPPLAPKYSTTAPTEAAKESAWYGLGEYLADKSGGGARKTASRITPEGVVEAIGSTSDDLARATNRAQSDAAGLQLSKDKKFKDLYGRLRSAINKSDTASSNISRLESEVEQATGNVERAKYNLEKVKADNQDLLSTARSDISSYLKPGESKADAISRLENDLAAAYDERNTILMQHAERYGMADDPSYLDFAAQVAENPMEFAKRDRLAAIEGARNKMDIDRYSSALEAITKADEAAAKAEFQFIKPQRELDTLNKELGDLNKKLSQFTAARDIYFKDKLSPARNEMIDFLQQPLSDVKLLTEVETPVQKLIRELTSGAATADSAASAQRVGGQALTDALKTLPIGGGIGFAAGQTAGAGLGGGIGGALSTAALAGGLSAANQVAISPAAQGFAAREALTASRLAQSPAAMQLMNRLVSDQSKNWFKSGGSNSDKSKTGGSR